MAVIPAVYHAARSIEVDTKHPRLVIGLATGGYLHDYPLEPQDLIRLQHDINTFFRTHYPDLAAPIVEQRKG